MKRIFHAAVLSFAVGGFIIAVPQAADAGKKVCTTVEAKAHGLHKAHVAKRAERKVKRRVNKWAHKHKVKVVYVGHKHVKCAKVKHHVKCTAYAKACK